ncbi:DUF1826 domain-containing protein [Pseudooceanicola sp. C21-150M6]|uniref:DUF1826 domain-containing protein n=1 Tax=Pseudooceanicola sp. C21-150M6 TaxID=3434355 RepID=UPI003D7FC1F0
MTALRAISAEAQAGVLTVGAPSDVSLIRGRGVAALIWQRRPLASFQHWIDALDPADLPRVRAILRPDAARSFVTQACDSAGTPQGPERDRLIDDIAALADIFAGVTGAPWLRLRLDVVTGNACRRFHIDRVTARLVCTYRGTGTQYGFSDRGEPEVIHTVPTGAPFVMRGTIWPARPDPGLLHRSPPIEGTGETRLMLALDPVHDPEEEA